jgi:AcrR family transcriptional regulator
VSVVLPSEFVVVTTPRAKPMSVEQRQDQIISVTIELLLEHGRDVTSKEIAEAAGIAEGTIFRAFGDKETLIEAAVDRYFDPLPLRTALGSIDRDLPLDGIIRRVVELMAERFRNVVRIMIAVGRDRPPARPENRQEFANIVGDLLEPYRDELALEPSRVAYYIRLLAFSSAMPGMTEDMAFDLDELTELIMHGIVEGKR